MSYFRQRLPRTCRDLEVKVSDLLIATPDS